MAFCATVVLSFQVGQPGERMDCVRCCALRYSLLFSPPGNVFRPLTYNRVAFNNIPNNTVKNPKGRFRSKAELSPPKTIKLSWEI